MSTDLATRPPDTLAVPTVTPERVYNTWLDSLTVNTRRAYEGDVRRFAAFRQASPVLALAGLIAVGHGQAALIAHDYLAALKELSTATIARRLAALRSFLSFARKTGLITWSLDVDSPTVEPYRDVRGPGDESLKRIFATLAARAAKTAKGKRDLAMVSLLFFNALRRAAVVRLDVEDVELGPDPAVWIIAKGRTDKERKTISLVVCKALAAWLDVRRPGPGALFLPLDRASTGDDRLTADGLQWIVAELGKAAGCDRKLTAHMFRHAAGTRAARTGDIFKVQAIGGWKKAETAQRYIDESKDVYGEVTRLLADDFPELL